MTARVTERIDNIPERGRFFTAKTWTARSITGDIIEVGELSRQTALKALSL
jgi:hypothetical protein